MCWSWVTSLALIKDYEALLKRLVQDFQFNFRQPALKLLNFIYIILKCLFIRLTLTFTRTRARRGTKVDQFNPPAKKRKKKRASFDQRRLVGYLLYTWEECVRNSLQCSSNCSIWSLFKTSARQKWVKYQSYELNQGCAAEHYIAKALAHFTSNQ